MSSCTACIRAHGRRIHTSKGFKGRVSSQSQCRRGLGSSRRACVPCALAEDGQDLEALDALLQELTARRRDKEKELHAVEALINAAQHKRDDIAMQTSEVVGSSSSDYSFKTRSVGVYLDNESEKLSTPTNIFHLAQKNFMAELRALLRFLADARRARTGDDRFLNSVSVDDYGSECTDDDEPCVISEDAMRQRAMLKELRLDNAAVWARERARKEPEGPILVKLPYFLLCYLLDALFSEKEPIARFFFLETVARMPYFSYISMIHLYESLGWWRRGAHVKQIHVAEEWNEFHHLLIMESLGGDLQWRTRFMAQHAAIAYYWVLVLLWALSPTAAYYFSELLEGHAVDTYGQFVDQNEELLRQLPAPRVARAYYQGPDLYYFDEFQTSMPPGTRRPVISTLYDTFSNIRDDEGEHVKTMHACQDPDIRVSPPNSSQASLLVGASTLLVASLILKEQLPELDAMPPELSSLFDLFTDFLSFM